jgi:hypothetical protein
MRVAVPARWIANSSGLPDIVIASEAKQSSGLAQTGLLRRSAPRNDELSVTYFWIAFSYG